MSTSKEIISSNIFKSIYEYKIIFLVLILTLMVGNNSHSYEVEDVYEEAWLPNEFNVLNAADSYNGRDVAAIGIWNNYADIFSIILPRQVPEWNNGVSDVAGILDDSEVDDYYGLCYGEWPKDNGNETRRGIANPEHLCSIFPLDGVYDIALNSQYSSCQNSDCFTNVMIHELGHAIGLGHNFSLESIMTTGSSERPTSGNASLQLYPDDVKYLYEKFPNSIKPNVIDLGVWPDYFDSITQKWKKADVDRGILGLYYTGEELTVNGIYIGNMGITDLNNVTIKLYLSTDNIYSVSDIELGTVYSGAISGAEGEKYNSTSIIPYIPVGNYFVIAVAFYNGSSLDSLEYNNQAIIQEITIFPLNSTLTLNAQPSTLNISQASTVSATVLDSNSNPVPSSQVTFSTGYPGTLTGCTGPNSACVTVTNASGVASVSFTSNIPGTASILATGENGGADSVNVTFESVNSSVTASPNPVNVSNPSTITADLGGSGAGQVVTFSTSSPGLFSPGNVSGSAQSTANGSGVATINFVPSAAGNAIITVNSGISDPQTVSLEVLDPNADKQISFTVSYSVGGSTWTRYNIEALVTNAQGQPVVGQAVDFALLTSNGNFLDTHETTGPFGKVDVELNITSSGTTTFRATAGTAVRTESFQAFVGQANVAEMTPIRTFNMTGSVYGLDFSPDENSLYAATKSGYVRGWNTSNYSDKFSQFDYGEDLYQLSVRPDNNAFLAGTGEGVAVFSASTGSIICFVNPPDNEQRTHVAWTSNSSWLETTYYNLFRRSSQCGSSSTPNGQPSVDHEFDRRSGFEYNFDISRGALSTSEGELIIVDSSGNLVTRLTLSAGDNAHDVDFSSDGSKLVAAYFTSAKIFNTSSWVGIGTLNPPGISGRKYGVEFLDNDTKVAIGGDGRVEVMGATGGPSTRYANINGLAIKMDWNETTKELAVGTSSGKVYIFRPLEPIDNIKPIISVNSPQNNYETNQVSINTTGSVTDNVNISSFTINGSNISVNGSGSFSSTVSLAPGSNTITYIAKDPSNNTTTVIRSVNRLVDSIAPSITNTSVNPSQGIIGTVFTISSTIIDESGIQSANAVIKNNSGTTIATLPLSNSSGNTYQATYNSTGLSLGFYTVDIDAVDNSGFNNTTTIIGATGFEVIDIPPDITPPVISNANVSPSSALQGAQFVITADVVDSETGVAQVTAKIKSSMGSIVASQTMVIGNGQTYSTSWDSTGEAGDVYTVDITAVDSSPQSNYSSILSAVSFEVTVGPPDLTAPVISNVDVNPIYGEEGTLFSIDADVEDVDSGVGNVSAKVKTALGSIVDTLPMSHTGGLAFSATWDSTGANEDVYSVDITAIDNSPAQNEATMNDAVVLEVIPDPLIFKDGFEGSNSDCTYTISNPGGGETWLIGSVHVLRWNASGNDCGTDVKLELYENGVLDHVISASTLNDGEYDWLLGNSLVTGSNYKLKVTDESNSSYNLLSSNFSISATPFQDCNECPLMISITGGTFQMGDLSGLGDSWEQPVHTVSVPSFSMGIYEVTFDEWDACFADGGCSLNPDDEGWGRGQRPVINVTWDDAQEYVNWLSMQTGKNYRLPTEAEWEYAARAGTTTAYWWGDSIGINNANCNSNCLDSFANTSPVGSFPANPFGLFDMNGNVWEWVEDCKNINYTNAPNDGSSWNSGDCNKHMDRGGAWINPAISLRSADRAASEAASRYTLGFRVVKDLNQQSSTIILNDTGITWSGSYDSGNNTICDSNLLSHQDCHQGRDATHNDDSDGHAGFSFTKLDANGNVLASSAVNWSCVKDNVTGLVWEVKTDDAGFHDKDNTYRWGGITHQGSNYGTYYNDWDSLVNGSNSSDFCGYNDWRIPTTQELMSIVDNGRFNPSIDTDYFNNTQNLFYWSASPNSINSSYAWGVGFDFGSSHDGTQDRSLSHAVRLVRY